MSSEHGDAVLMPLPLSNDEMEDAIDWRQEWFYEFNLGDEDDGSGHPWKDFIDASFALVTKEWKYVVWPQHDNYEQLFHRSVDPYEEYDLLHRQLRPNVTDDSNIQTTRKIYYQMKHKFKILKDRAQRGHPV